MVAHVLDSFVTKDRNPAIENVESGTKILTRSYRVQASSVTRDRSNNGKR